MLPGIFRMKNQKSDIKSLNNSIFQGLNNDLKYYLFRQEKIFNETVKTDKRFKMF